uniref:RILP-like protein 2 n=1 Tax=Kryptolebias marmoratus TaxID=37003 RepID=A0A3Q3AYZ2_KRYMA
MEPESGSAQPGCLGRTFSALTVDDVYEIAKLIGAEVEKLIDGYGKASVEGLVPRIVKVLELLESFASRNHALGLREEELLRTFEAIQRQQQQQKKCEELQVQVQQLQEDREELQNRLKGTCAKEDRAQKQEREVMLKLKQVVDKQRDELRAKAQEITTISKEVEALQEQLDRFMKMNGELRHKQNVLQTQLRGAVERKADMEADLKEKNKETDPSKAAEESSKQPTESQLGLDQPCFTKKEVRDILFERNELKTNLFLVQEELNYYQREILNEERCPGFLLEAVRSAIKKKRRLIKAKMLGTPATECNSRLDAPRGAFLTFKRSETRTQEARSSDLWIIMEKKKVNKSDKESGFPLCYWIFWSREPVKQQSRGLEMISRRQIKY